MSEQLDHQAERYCLRCANPLPEARLGAEESPRCARCGLQFDPENPNSYSHEPPTLAWNFWFPGISLAIASGVLSYAIIIMANGNIGTALFVGVPLSFGAVLGYAVRVRIWLLVMLGLTVVAGVIVSLVAMNLVGFFCGFTLGGVFFGPMILGMALGRMLAWSLKISRWRYWRYLPMIAILATPYVWSVVEHFLPHEPIDAEVITDLTFHSTAQEAWDSIMFYEEVEHAPPALLKILLSVPLRSEGSKQHVGDVVRCVYSRGHLVKQISEREAGRRLAFNVTEQTIVPYNVELSGGSFDVERIDDEHARVKLTTRYRRHLSPSFEWEPIERAVIHSLHEHVLEGMRRRAERHEAPPYPAPPQPEPNTAAALERVSP